MASDDHEADTVEGGTKGQAPAATVLTASLFGAALILGSVAGSTVETAYVKFSGPLAFPQAVAVLVLGSALFWIGLRGLRGGTPLVAAVFAVILVVLYTGDRGSTVTQIRTTAIEVAATSVHDPQGTLDYGAENMIDRNDVTAWNSSPDSDGVGERLTFTFDRGYRLVRIEILNGYDKRTATEDRWHQNSRVRAITVRTDGGERRLTLEDHRDWQALPFNFGTTEFVEIEVLSIYEGDGGVIDGRRWEPDLALSEIRFLHRAR